MIDHRKLNTAEIIGMGILAKSPPKSKIPKKIDLVEIDESEGLEVIRSKLEKEAGVSVSMYYGCWAIWRTEQGYFGELYQYYSRTDEFDEFDLDAAVAKAEEWFLTCNGFSKS